MIAGTVPSIRRAADHLDEIRSRAHPGAVYLDLDGTLLGPGGTLFGTGRGAGSGGPAAVAALHRAGIEIVLVSGRIRAQTRELARVLGAGAYASEMGAELTLRDGGRERSLVPEAVAGLPRSPHELIVRGGAGGFLLDRFAGRLEPHAPWAFLPRSSSLLLRGAIVPAEADAALSGAGYGWLQVLDNGILPRGADRWPHLDLDEVRAYHLLPRGVDKRAAVTAHRRALGLPADACIAIGDAASDAACASEVGVAFVVANGEAAVRELDLPGNVFLLDGWHGDGVAEAVSFWLGG